MNNAQRLQQMIELARGERHWTTLECSHARLHPRELLSAIHRGKFIVMDRERAESMLVDLQHNQVLSENNQRLADANAKLWDRVRQLEAQLVEQPKHQPPTLTTETPSDGR